MIDGVLIHINWYGY